MEQTHRALDADIQDFMRLTTNHIALAALLGASNVTVSTSVWLLHCSNLLVIDLVSGRRSVV